MNFQVQSDRPVMISTSRFVGNGYELDKAFVHRGSVEVINDNFGICRVINIPEKAEIEWELTFYPDEKEIETVVLDLPALGPIWENIAEQARASASSIYFWGDQNGYGRPEGANDGRTFRAWEAAEGETSGWIELIWEKPVTFDKIEIDEWQESGGEIQSWELEAGHKKSEFTQDVRKNQF